jgi:hypothetical protein
MLSHTNRFETTPRPLVDSLNQGKIHNRTLPTTFALRLSLCAPPLTPRGSEVGWYGGFDPLDDLASPLGLRHLAALLFVAVPKTLG